jgi:hypothetical protein
MPARRIAACWGSAVAASDAAAGEVATPDPAVGLGRSWWAAALAMLARSTPSSSAHRSSGAAMDQE